MAPQDLLVSLNRVLHAPPPVVFGALTDPALFGQWIGPENADVTVEELTVAIGGRLAFTVSIPEYELSFKLYGYYEVIEPPNRLVHSWALEGEDEISTVVFELEAHESGTRLSLTHHGLTKPEDVADNDSGWKACLDRLERLVTLT